MYRLILDVDQADMGVHKVGAHEHVHGEVIGDEERDSVQHVPKSDEEIDGSRQPESMPVGISEVRHLNWRQLVLAPTDGQR